MISKIVSYLNHKENIKRLSRSLIQLKVQEAKTQKRFRLETSDITPFLTDNTNTTQFDRHYIYHPAWAARILKQTNPAVHVDIASSLHFCSIISAFILVRFYDYRPAELVLSDLQTAHQDLTLLTFESNSIDSLSCMHSVEHVGLGRYGDQLDYDGDEKAMSELARVLKPGGNFLFVTPIGAKAKIVFNAHRIYTKELILDAFKKFGLTLKEFSLIPEKSEDGGIVSNPNKELLQKQVYGCGCFWFTK